jgi:hypothetical protein
MSKSDLRFMRHLLSAVIISIIALNIGYAQNSTTWPYGGEKNLAKRDSLMAECQESIVDSARCESLIGIPLSFKNGLTGPGIFDLRGEFRFADFSDTIVFSKVKFLNGIDLRDAVFDSTTNVEFTDAEFSERVVFSNTHFLNGISFNRATFDSSTNVSFNYADFSDTVNFDTVKFLNGVDLRFAAFDSTARAFFRVALFSDTVSFSEATFGNGVFFVDATFDSTTHVSFKDARLGAGVLFWETKFHNGVNFRGATFDSSMSVLFWGTHFSDTARFTRTKFLNGAHFGICIFGDSITSVENAVVLFKDGSTGADINFNGTKIYGSMFFQGMKFESTSSNKVEGSFDSGIVDLNLKYLSQKDEPWAIFHNSEIYDTINIGTKGTWDPQNFDFSLALFPEKRRFYSEIYTQFSVLDTIHYLDFYARQLPDNFGSPEWLKQQHPDSLHLKYYDTTILRLAKPKEVRPAIVLYGPVKLKMQIEKFKHLSFAEGLSYFDKKNIIEYLKQNSYTGSDFKKERFELDYLFACATAYDKVSTDPDTYAWYNPVRWLVWLYGITIGYGYRPYWLLPWALGIAVLFAALYYRLRKGKFSKKVGDYVGRLDSSDANWKGVWRTRPEAIYFCFWFSITVLLAFRLKPRLLVSFDPWEKRFIITEYVIGLFLYVYFIIGSKAGSIGMTFVQLFTG